MNIERVPFAFHVALPDEARKPDASTRTVISKSIETDVLAHPSHVFSEDVDSTLRSTVCFQGSPSYLMLRPHFQVCTLPIKSYMILMTLCIRTFIANIVRFVFPYWQSTSDWLGRHSRSPVEPVYRNTITHDNWSYWVGPVR